MSIEKKIDGYILRKIESLTAERDRLKSINSDLCNKSNHYLIQNARLEEERNALTARVAELERDANRMRPVFDAALAWSGAEPSTSVLARELDAATDAARAAVAAKGAGA